MIYENILEFIGRTPIVKLNKMNSNPNVSVYLKLEGQNPGGSIKDRIALAMIEDAEKNGKLDKSKTIIEATSGNTGIGLAMVAASKGYEIILAMSREMSLERRKILKAYGAKVILTSKKQGTDGAIEMVKKIVQKNPQKYWMPDQFSNPVNVKTNYNQTAQEILSDVPWVTHFVSGLGTSGTISGIGKKLRKQKKGVRVIAVEPFSNHKLQGLKNMKEAKNLGFFKEDMFDEKVNIRDENAFETVRNLAKKEGLFLGMSSGAAVFVALEIAQKIKKGHIVAMSPDRGERYLSANLF